MSGRVHRSKELPERKKLSWTERWQGPDCGLITSWEVGRRIRKKDTDLACRARRDEVHVLGWKGGVDRPLKSGVKRGTLLYLAMLQGLKGEDLDIDMSKEYQLTCTRTGVMVIYCTDLNNRATPRRS